MLPTVDAILEAYRHDRPRFIAYARTDARLVAEILEAERLVDYCVERSRLVGLPPDRVGASIAAFDFIYLSALRGRGVVAPTVGGRGGWSAAAGTDGSRGDSVAHTLGGHLIASRPGLHRMVLVCDFRSLYPSIIRTFNIDPLGYRGQVRQEAGVTGSDDTIVAPNGARFARGEAVLPAMLDELFPQRAAAKRAGNNVVQNAIKILMNSFYGVLGTPACRFYNPHIANAITAFGRRILVWSQERVEAYGHRVLYGDTDSIFIDSGTDDPDEAWSTGTALVGRLNDDLSRFIAEEWAVPSALELELERLYLALFLPSIRGGKRGAAKRYVGLVHNPGAQIPGGAGAAAGAGHGLPPGQLVFTGMEVVRRDWTDLAKLVQREIYRRLFAGLPVAPYVKRVVAELRDGRHDQELVYRKGIRKNPNEYKAAPPHVVAARQLDEMPQLVTYHVTVAGPEPLERHRHQIDYDHYVEHQIRPIVEPVLLLEGVGFDSIAGSGQLDLFGP